MESFTFKSAIRRYHVYKDIWTAPVDDKLSVEREFKNQFHRFAVKIILDGETIGHLPREFSKIARYFIARGGVITVAVKGPRQRVNSPSVE